MSAKDPDIRIQPVTPNELERLAGISRTTFYETFASVNTPEDMNSYLEHNLGNTQLLKELNNPHSAFYLAGTQAEDLGYFKINFDGAQTVPDQHNSLELERIYVVKTAKGKGTGQRMLRQAIQTARERELSYLWLGVWEHNPEAIRFYEKNGFRKYGQHIFKLGSDDQTDLLMKLEL